MTAGRDGIECPLGHESIARIVATGIGRLQDDPKFLADTRTEPWAREIDTQPAPTALTSALIPVGPDQVNAGMIHSATGASGRAALGTVMPARRSALGTDESSLDFVVGRGCRRSS